jgi:cyclopropane fatty-acyl-phospholipid synthase-like methyltransferase
MHVDTKRWGEVSIKKQAKEGGKNNFDSTRSFSIVSSPNHYDISQLKELYEIVTDLTEKYSFEEFKKKLMGFGADQGKRERVGQDTNPMP